MPIRFRPLYFLFVRTKLIISGGYDAIHCTDLLKKHDVPAILGGVYRTLVEQMTFMTTLRDSVATRKKLACDFVLHRMAALEHQWFGNLPFHAERLTLMACPWKLLLRSITLSTAEILGVDEQVGSLEAGKDATLVITDGTMFLDIRTQVEAAFIRWAGWRIYPDRHKKLYYKYDQRINRKAAEQAAQVVDSYYDCKLVSANRK